MVAVDNKKDPRENVSVDEKFKDMTNIFMTEMLKGMMGKSPVDFSIPPPPIPPSKKDGKSGSTEPISSIIDPLVIASSLADVIKELDFVVNCDIEGDVDRDQFEPKIKISFKIARSMESVLKLKQAEIQESAMRHDAEIKLFEAVKKDQREQDEKEERDRNTKEYMKTMERIIKETTPSLLSHFAKENQPPSSNNSDPS